MTTNGASGNAAITNGFHPNAAAVLMELCLPITDQDLIDELNGYQDEDARKNFALSALKIGVIAMRQAQGRIDAERVRQEGDRFIENMGLALAEHQRGVTQQIGDSLKSYFDPQSGRFNERVQRLVAEGGELERIIRAQVEGDSSRMAQTLMAHVGHESPVMRVLDPNASNGLITQFAQATEKTLSDQRERILREFSLDNGEGALSRLVLELTNKHGDVGKALENRIGEVMGEFSLDKEDSALSRLVGRVETAQLRISSEFDLNQDNSALARMRKEFMGAIETQRQTNEQFHTQVIEKLAEMSARKQESERSTRHGLEFEQAVFNFVNEQHQKAGDIVTPTGNTTGLIRNNRKGDAVIEIGPEAAAAGAKIVIEAKEDASYNLPKAREELEEARKNRGANIGVFVFSKRTALAGLEAFNRYGNDIVVVWDAEDPASDVFLSAGLSVAKALCTRANTQAKETGADFEAIEKAILEIERQSNGLEEITTSAQTVRNSSEKILNRARIMGEGLTKQIAILNEKVAALRETIGNES